MRKLKTISHLSLHSREHLFLNGYINTIRQIIIFPTEKLENVNLGVFFIDMGSPNGSEESSEIGMQKSKVTCPKGLNGADFTLRWSPVTKSVSIWRILL